MNCFETSGCYQCLYGINGCLGPSRVYDNQHNNFSAQFEELEEKLNTLAKKKSGEIEKYLEQQKKEQNGLIKILILGGPSSGKSTIFKQMNIIHCDGFKRPDQLEYFKGLIYSNIRDIFDQLITGANLLGISLESIQNHINRISEEFKRSDVGDQLDPTIGNDLHIFWKSSPIQLIFSRRCDIELLDSAKYYMQNIERIYSTDYIPDVVDIVHSRRLTTSINSINFMYTGLRLNMIDVGGQRSERRKWIHLFDDARVVLFVIDLTGFAKKSSESRQDIFRYSMFKRWRDIADSIYDMRVALKIYHEVVSNRILRQAVFLLFFNKVDLFAELIQFADFRKCFPKFVGHNNYDDTTNYIREKFVKASHRTSVFPHFTTATNTKNIEVVFRACMESVFKVNSRSTGLA